MIDQEHPDAPRDDQALCPPPDESSKRRLIAGFPAFDVLSNPNGNQSSDQESLTVKRLRRQHRQRKHRQRLYQQQLQQNQKEVFAQPDHSDEHHNSVKQIRMLGNPSPVNTRGRSNVQNSNVQSSSGNNPNNCSIVSVDSLPKPKSNRGGWNRGMRGMYRGRGRNKTRSIKTGKGRGGWNRGMSKKKDNQAGESKSPIVNNSSHPNGKKSDRTPIIEENSNIVAIPSDSKQEPKEALKPQPKPKSKRGGWRGGIKKNRNQNAQNQVQIQDKGKELSTIKRRFIRKDESQNQPSNEKQKQSTPNSRKSISRPANKSRGPNAKPNTNQQRSRSRKQKPQKVVLQIEDDQQQPVAVPQQKKGKPKEKQLQLEQSFSSMRKPTTKGCRQVREQSLKEKNHELQQSSSAKESKSLKSGGKDNSVTNANVQAKPTGNSNVSRQLNYEVDNSIHNSPFQECSFRNSRQDMIPEKQYQYDLGRVSNLKESHKPKEDNEDVVIIERVELRRQIYPKMKRQEPYELSAYFRKQSSLQSRLRRMSNLSKNQEFQRFSLAKRLNSIDQRQKRNEPIKPSPIYPGQRLHKIQNLDTNNFNRPNLYSQGVRPVSLIQPELHNPNIRSTNIGLKSQKVESRPVQRQFARYFEENSINSRQSSHKPFSFMNFPISMMSDRMIPVIDIENQFPPRPARRFDNGIPQYPQELKLSEDDQSSRLKPSITTNLNKTEQPTSLRFSNPIRSSFTKFSDFSAFCNTNNTKISHQSADLVPEPSPFMRAAANYQISSKTENKGQNLQVELEIKRVENKVKGKQDESEDQFAGYNCNNDEDSQEEESDKGEEYRNQEITPNFVSKKTVKKSPASRRRNRSIGRGNRRQRSRRRTNNNNPRQKVVENEQESAQNRQNQEHEQGQQKSHHSNSKSLDININCEEQKVAVRRCSTRNCRKNANIKQNSSDGVVEILISEEISPEPEKKALKPKGRTRPANQADTNNDNNEEEEVRQGRIKRKYVKRSPKWFVTKAYLKRQARIQKQQEKDNLRQRQAEEKNVSQNNSSKNQDNMKMSAQARAKLNEYFENLQKSSKSISEQQDLRNSSESQSESIRQSQEQSDKNELNENNEQSGQSRQRNNPARKRAITKIMTCGHNNRQYHAKGKCKNCYSNEMQKRKRDRKKGLVPINTSENPSKGTENEVEMMVFKPGDGKRRDFERIDSDNSNEVQITDKAGNIQQSINVEQINLESPGKQLKGQSQLGTRRSQEKEGYGEQGGPSETNNENRQSVTKTIPQSLLLDV